MLALESEGAAVAANNEFLGNFCMSTWRGNSVREILNTIVMSENMFFKNRFYF